MARRKSLTVRTADTYDEIINKVIPEIRECFGDDIDIIINRFEPLDCYFIEVMR